MTKYSPPKSRNRLVTDQICFNLTVIVTLKRTKFVTRLTDIGQYRQILSGIGRYKNIWAILSDFMVISSRAKPVTILAKQI